MKKLIPTQRLPAIALGIALLFGGISPASAEEKNILVFGSSAWHGVIDDLPEMAKAGGDTANVRCLRGRMETYAEAMKLEETDPENPKAMVALETEYSAKVRIKDEITAKKFDVVILHPHSTAMEPEVFRDDAKTMFAYVKKYQPDALIIINENQSDRGDGIRNRGTSGTKGNAPIKPAKPRGANFLYDTDTMYEDGAKAVKTVADELGVAIAPVGYAFHLAKTHPLWGYQFPHPNFDYENAKPPALPKNTKSLWVGASWKKDKKTGEEFLGIDHHKKNAGRYLQAAVFYEIIFKKSVAGNSYVSDAKILKKGSDIDYSANIPLSAEDHKALQTIAHEAVAKFHPDIIK